MLKFFSLIIVGHVVAGGVATAQDDCDCGYNPYVTYELSDSLEMDENPWRVVSVNRYDTDLTQADEHEVCVVYLQLIPPTDPILYKDFMEIPEDDQELRWGKKWVLKSEFEDQMNANGCDLAGTMS